MNWSNDDEDKLEKCIPASSKGGLVKPNKQQTSSSESRTSTLGLDALADQKRKDLADKLEESADSLKGGFLGRAFGGKKDD